MHVDYQFNIIDDFDELLMANRGEWFKEGSLQQFYFSMRGRFSKGSADAGPLPAQTALFAISLRME